MKQAIDDQSQNLPSQVEFSNLLTKLFQNGVDMINSENKNTRHKEFGIMLLDCLLDVNDEFFPDRRCMIANHLKRILNVEKSTIPLETCGPYMLSAAISLGHLSRIANTTEIELLQDEFVHCAVEWLCDKVDAKRYAGTILLMQFTINSPNIIHNKRKNIFGNIFNVLSDKNLMVREAAGELFSVALIAVTQRDGVVVEYIKAALNQVDVGFLSSVTEKVLGSLMLLDILVNPEVVSHNQLVGIINEKYQKKNTTGGSASAVASLIWHVLQKKDSKETEIRKKTVQLVPKLAGAFASFFVAQNPYTRTSNFLVYYLTFLLKDIKNKKDREVCFLSLGHLFQYASASLRVVDMMADILPIIDEGFKFPFCIEALQCFTMLIHCSPLCRRYITTKLIDNVFNGGLSADLLSCLKAVMKFVPRCRGHIQERVRDYVYAFLLSHSVMVDDGVYGKQLQRTVSATTAPKTTCAVTSATVSAKDMSQSWLSSPGRPAASGSSGSSKSRIPFFGSNSKSSSQTVSKVETSTAAALNAAVENQIVLAIEVLASFEFFPKQICDIRNTTLVTVNSSGRVVNATPYSSHPDCSENENAAKGKENDAILKDQNPIILGIVQDAVMRYLDDSNPAVRMAAATTAVTVMDKVMGASLELDLETSEAISRIIDRILMLGVGDEMCEIRGKVFSLLTPCMDYSISQSESISCIIESLNDEDLYVRSSAMAVLCRVAQYDQVHVMPLVRVVLKRIIRRLLSTKDQNLRQETVIMLQSMVRGSSTLIVPYVELLLEPLLILLKDPSGAIAGAALSSIGELSVVAPERVRGHLDEIFPPLIKALYDVASIQNQETAVVVLGKLVTSLNMMTGPYKKYPLLLEGIIHAIQNYSESASQLRLQAIKTAGLLGAVDAELYQKHLQNDGSAAASISGSEVGNIEHHSSPSDAMDESSKKQKQGLEYCFHQNFSMESGDDMDFSTDATSSTNLHNVDQYFVDIIFKGLIDILTDSSLASHHANACAVSGKVIRILAANKSDCYLPMDDLFKALVQLLYKTGAVNNNLQNSLFEQVIAIIHVTGVKVLRYQDIITKLVNDYFNSRLQPCLDIIEALSLVLPVENFNNVFRLVLPGMLLTMRNEPLESVPVSQAASRPMTPAKYVVESKNLPKTRSILQTVANISLCLGEYRQQLIPVILCMVDMKNVSHQTIKLAICTVMHLAKYVDLMIMASQIIQSMLRVIVNPEQSSLHGTAYTSLSYIVCKLGNAFVPYILPIRRKIRSAHPERDSYGSHSSAHVSGQESLPQLVEYEALVLKLLKHRELPAEPASAVDISVRHDMISDNRDAAVTVDSAALPVNLQAIETAWALSRTTSQDITEWMRRLAVEFIRQSPSPIIRQCMGLAKNHPQLSELLFNGAFVALWDEVFAAQSAHHIVEDIGLIHAIEIALQSKEIPTQVLQALLELTEFMEMQDKALPINTVLLAKQAQLANTYAKCLRYREIEFQSPNLAPSSECIESLIFVNNQLGLHDSAMGILNYVRNKYRSVDIQPAWLEELNKWDDARLAYETIVHRWERECPRDMPHQHKEWMQSELGLLRCLYTVGEFEMLNDSAIMLKDQLRDYSLLPNSIEAVQNIEEHAIWSAEVRTQGANAAWMLGKWDVMEDFLEEETMNTLGGSSFDLDSNDVILENQASYYKAVIAIHKEDYSNAQLLINDIRSMFANSIGSLLNRSYHRAYHAMVTMQVLSEMEEVIEYKQAVALASVEPNDQNAFNYLANTYSSYTPSGNGRLFAGTMNELVVDDGDAIEKKRKADLLEKKKKDLLKQWKGRLDAAPRDVNVYRHILAVHTLVADPLEDLDSWLQFVSLCRKNGYYSLCENTLRRLGATNIPITAYSSCKAVLEASDSSSATPTISINTAVVHTPSNSLHYPPVSSTRRVALGACKYLWMIQEKNNALNSIKDLISTLEPDEALKGDNNWSAAFAAKDKNDPRMFKVKALLKCAQWMREMDNIGAVPGTTSGVDDSSSVLVEILKTVKRARDLAPDYCSVWHAWAVTNFLQLQKQTDILNGGSSAKLEKASNYRASIFNWDKNDSLGADQVQLDSMTCLVIEAIRGFTRSINYGQEQSAANILQDTLRLLTLWFNYGSNEAVYDVLKIELDTVSAEHWLLVIPQLIARIQMKSPEISGLLRKLLVKIADVHPQALVCPISVAYNTTHEQQRMVSAEVIVEMRRNRSQLVDEATMLSRELMRVAMTPHELWHGGLEKAAQNYVSEHDLDAMLQTLTELHEALEDSTLCGNGDMDVDLEAHPEVRDVPLAAFSEDMGKIGFCTLRDISFRQCYGRELEEGRCWLDKYRLSRSTADLHQAWEVYQGMFKKITAQLKTFQKLELKHVSAALTTAKNLSLAVPGTYKPFVEEVCIRSFSPSVDVIASKQRPRKMAIWGSDGKSYMFLLKGNEDLRQDERVMQLFGLINTCLENDRTTKSSYVSIQRYSVLPISNNSGVIGWVKNCDTLNQLVKEYRKSTKVSLDLERRLIASKTGSPDDILCTKYDKLPLIHKLAVFTDSMRETTGSDLEKMLWLTSKTSDVWIERRLTFTKSLAVMSMVGYILGLGDRHPSNLMLDRVSGQIVHIDFGDCFEVAMKRNKYPETVPFRLTRMLVKSMEASGIEGTFRTTCEKVYWAWIYIYICRVNVCFNVRPTFGVFCV